MSTATLINKSFICLKVELIFYLTKISEVLEIWGHLSDIGF